METRMLTLPYISCMAHPYMVIVASHNQKEVQFKGCGFLQCSAGAKGTTFGDKRWIRIKDDIQTRNKTI